MRRAVLTIALMSMACESAATATAEVGTIDEASATAPTTTMVGTTDEGTTAEGTTAEVACDEVSELYERTIAPLLVTDQPSSCNSCHLSGVDLSLFVRDTPCQTMACLVDRGLVDLDVPAQSTVLGWISRADPASPLIDQDVIDREYAAFLEWISATATCGLCFTDAEPCGEALPSACADEDLADFEDPGDCSAYTREALFLQKVYAWRDRCFPCHFDNQKIDAPKWLKTGTCALGSLQTMHTVLADGLVDLQNPGASLLLRKPLAEAAGGVPHGGHEKFAGPDDPAYLDMLAWITREAACTP